MPRPITSIANILISSCACAKDEITISIKILFFIKRILILIIIQPIHVVVEFLLNCLSKIKVNELD